MARRPLRWSVDRRGFIALAGSTLFAGCSLRRDSTESEAPDTRTDTHRPTPSDGEIAPMRVGTRDGLLTALESATRGDVVAVDPTAEIDLSGLWNVHVPTGVTVAGGRGVAGAAGARLYSPEGDNGPRGQTDPEKFRLGEGARFTGFRLSGHHDEYVNPEEAYDGDYFAHTGVGVRVGAGGVVDHCDISGWPFAAVLAEDDAHVHNNFLHHNTWEGLGYGVAVPKGEHMPIIEFNEFNYNRHSITSARSPEPGYVARFNVVGEDWVGHQFDVHGTEGMTGVAGDKFVIHNNTFRATRAVEAKTRDPGGEYPAIHVRGTPTTGAWIERNWFYHETQEAAFAQPNGPEKVHFANNHYGRSEPTEFFVGAQVWRVTPRVVRAPFDWRTPG